NFYEESENYIERKIVEVLEGNEQEAVQSKDCYAVAQRQSSEDMYMEHYRTTKSKMELIKEFEKAVMMEIGITETRKEKTGEVEMINGYLIVYSRKEEFWFTHKYTREVRNRAEKSNMDDLLINSEYKNQIMDVRVKRHIK
ncbi:hypothetical protein HHI36_000755, partial [Cryptolaemus montrouzieri]